MGWNEYGKYGVCTGRTVRSPFAYSKRNVSWNPKKDIETLLKFTRGTENLSRHELDEFLSINKIDDGLDDFNSSSFQLASENVHYCSIFYSLKKRKRWTLVERFSQQLNNVEDGWKYAQNVTFIHRRVQRKLKADCIAVHKTNRNEVLRSKRHLYARASDLVNIGNQADVRPELCYEISYRYPLGSYPLHAEGHRVRGEDTLQWPVSKPRSKGKGAKNKGARWGSYTDAQIRDEQFLLKEEPIEIWSRQTFATNKVTIVKYTQLSMRKGSNLSNTEEFPPLAKEEEKSVVTTNIKIESQQGVSSANDLNLGTKRLYSEVVSGITGRCALHKEVDENDNVTASMESGDKFGSENVNVNQEDIAMSLVDEMKSSPVARISDTVAKHVPSDQEVQCSRLPSPPNCPKPATRRLPRVRLRTRDINRALEVDQKSSSVSCTEFERSLHSKGLTMRNTTKTHQSILPLRHDSPSLARPLCVKNSLQDLEVVGSKVTVHYNSHRLQRLKESRQSRNRSIAIKSFGGFSMPRQITQSLVPVREQRIMRTCSCQRTESSEQLYTQKWTIFGNKCALSSRHEGLWYENVPCTKWISQEPKILSLRPSFLPVLQGRRYEAAKKKGIHCVQKRSFAEIKQLTLNIVQAGQLSSRVRSQYGEETSSQDVKDLLNKQGITRKQRKLSTLRYCEKLIFTHN